MTHIALNSSKVYTGLSQTPEGVPQELFTHFYTVYSAIHNLERLLSLYAGVDPQPHELWPQLSIDDSVFDGNMNRWYPTAYEILNFGEAVSPILVGSDLQVRRASAANNTKWCCGFVNTEGTTGAGEKVEVKTRGLITGVSGMTPGSRLWLSTTDGFITNSPPVAAGNIVQVVGFALASNRLLCNLDSYFVQL